MAAGVKAERWRSCADGTLSEGFWLADEDVGHASHPSLSDWLVAFEGQLQNEQTDMCQSKQQGRKLEQTLTGFSRGAKIGPVAVGRRSRGGSLSRSWRCGGNCLLGWGGCGWGGCTQADGGLALRYPLSIIGWKPASAAPEFSSQPARFPRLRFIHLYKQMSTSF